MHEWCCIDVSVSGLFVHSVKAHNIISNSEGYYATQYTVLTYCTNCEANGIISRPVEGVQVMSQRGRRGQMRGE